MFIGDVSNDKTLKLDVFNDETLSFNVFLICEALHVVVFTL